MRLPLPQHLRLLRLLPHLLLLFLVLLLVLLLLLHQLAVQPLVALHQQLAPCSCGVRTCPLPIELPHRRYLSPPALAASEMVWQSLLGAVRAGGEGGGRRLDAAQMEREARGYSQACMCCILQGLQALPAARALHQRNRGYTGLERPCITRPAASLPAARPPVCS